MAVDVTDLVNFANDLRAGGKVLSTEGRAVVSKGGMNIKTGARRALRSQLSGARTSLWWLEPSITYDPPLRFGRHGWQTEVGPDQAISGLGLGTEEGSRHHAPMPFMAPSTHTEEPKFYAASDALMVKAYKL
jgi:hypothetical protein